MNSSIRRVALALGGLGAFASTLLTAPTAQAVAESRCAEAGTSGYSTICIYDRDNGYHAKLWLGGDLVGNDVEFSLICWKDNRSYGGTRYKAARGDQDWTFQVPRQGYCSFQLKDLTENKTWRTPSISR